MFTRALSNLQQQRDTASSTNRGCIITTVSWVLFTIVMFSLAVRLALKMFSRTIRMRLGLDDLFIGLAVFLNLGQTIAVTVASTHGLGQRYEYLTLSERAIYRKADFASTTLYIASIGCTRLAVCLPMAKALQGRMHRWTAISLTMLVVVWMISGAITSVLNCGSQMPWSSMGNDTCTRAFTNYLGFTNIILELLLILFFAAWNIRLSARHRALVLFTTITRFSIIAAVSAQLYLINNSATSDPTYDKWAVVICIQITQCLAIVVCLPYLRSTIPSTCTEVTDLEATDPCQKPGTFLGRLTPDLSKFSPRSTSSLESKKSSLKDKISPPCHPLATHGLIRASPSMDSRTFTHHLSDTAPPLSSSNPPENIFNRLIPVPHCRPGTSSDLDPLGIPRSLNDVGFLPAPDWDTEVEEVDSRRNSVSTRPVSEYVFNRQKVISISDEQNIYDIGRECKRFVPPLPSPQMFRQPPRAF